MILLLAASVVLAAGGERGPLVEDTPALARAREEMVRLIERRGVTNPRVLAALRKVLRHELVPEKLKERAYADRPWPIGHEQTISQPYIVGFMSEAADLSPGEKVLEVGTGSGYQAAVLATIGARVFSIEIVEPLAKRAQRDLARLGIHGVTVRHGDGYVGWPSEAPFDAIVVTAAPEKLPPALLEQLAEGGRLVIPVGPAENQVLEVYSKQNGKIRKRRVFPVRFVPMTGRAQEQE